MVRCLYKSSSSGCQTKVALYAVMKCQPVIVTFLAQIHNKFHLYLGYRITVITFRVRRSRGEMYIGHARLCLSLVAFPYYCTDPDVTWGMVGGARTVGRGFAIGARVSLL